jgi:hypothetical protein
MDKVWLAVLIMLVAGALPGIVFGYLIAVKQQWSMIAGWEQNKLKNPAAYARLIGFSLLGLGVAIALIAVGWALRLLSDEQMAVTLLLISLLPVFAAIVAHIRFGKA